MDPKINIEIPMGNGDIENPPYEEANIDEGMLMQGRASGMDWTLHTDL